MNYKYFGIVTQSDFLDWDEEKQNLHLIKLGVLNQSISITNQLDQDLKTPGKLGFLIPLTEENKQYRFSNKVCSEIYNWLLNKYTSYIKYYRAVFEAELKNVDFERNEEKKKKYALEKYISIFNEIVTDPVARLNDRFSTLYGIQAYQISELTEERKMVLAFLTGKEDFFNVPLYDMSTYLQNIVEFQGNLEILLYLNNTYKFETDLHFGEYAILLKKFQSIDKPSFTFETFRFMSFQIEKLGKNSFSDLVSLYLFLKEKKLISGPQNKIRSIITEMFTPVSSELKLSDRFNENHKKRLKILEKEWTDFLK